MHQYYVYQHRRSDTGKIFYVGIGQKSFKKVKGHRTEFERAYARSKRTKFWKSITNKTTYTVEIVLESDDKEFVQRTEQRLIKEYGRRCCDKNGILVNFQEGGESITGPRHRNIKIKQENLDGQLVKIWEQLSFIETETGWLKTNIVKCCRRKQITAYGFKWSYVNNESFDNIRATSARKKNTNRRVGIVLTHKITDDKHTFPTQELASFFLGVNRTTLHKYLHKKGQHKIYTIEYSTWSYN
tara:strand:- start:3 stop:728 length:726 start_codon:yes stop_codon:yes gene_type:complete